MLAEVRRSRQVFHICEAWARRLHPATFTVSSPFLRDGSCAGVSGMGGAGGMGGMGGMGLEELLSQMFL